MKKRVYLWMVLLLALLLTVIFIPTAVFAATEVASGTCGAQGDNLIWELTDDGLLIISGTGKMKDYNYDAPWIGKLESKITDIVILDGVTSIGKTAFSGMTEVEIVLLPNSVKTIGDYAFKSMGTGYIAFSEGLTTIGKSAFEGVQSMEVVDLPDSVTTIGSRAFANCDSLFGVYLPESLTSLGSQAFLGCDALEMVVFFGKAPEIGTNCFKNVNAYVNYPYGDSTWTSSKRKNYGGSLIWSEILSNPKVTISTNTNGKPTLKWNSIKGADYYEVYRTDDLYGDGELTILQTTKSTSFTDTKAVVGKTYYYMVLPCSNSNLWGFGSEIETAACVPATPSVSLQNKASSGKPRVTWDKVDGAKKYEVYRATSKSGTYKKIYTTTGTTCTNTSADAGKTYYYKVRAVDSAGNKGKFSSIKSITCDLPRPETSITVNATSGKPKLTWKKVDGAAKYEVWSATSKSGTYKKIYTTSGTVCTNTSAVAGKTYYYKVKAICGTNSNANSAYSTVKSATCDCAKPVVSISVNSSCKPKLTWKKVDGAAKYEVWRATSKSGTYTKMYTTSGTSYTNTSATAGKTYYYKVKAISKDKSAADSAFSAVKSIRAACAAPKLQGMNSSLGWQPVVAWDAVSGAVEYEVWRATHENESFVKIATTKNTEYTDETAEQWESYLYKVKAIGNTPASNSSFSDVIEISRPVPPFPMSATIDKASGKPKLTWEIPEGAEMVNVLRADSSNGDYKQISFTIPETDIEEDPFLPISLVGNSVIDTTAVPGKTYYYRIHNAA